MAVNLLGSDVCKQIREMIRLQTLFSFNSAGHLFLNIFHFGKGLERPPPSNTSNIQMITAEPTHLLMWMHSYRAQTIISNTLVST